MGAILVTGGAGYIGSHVVLALQDAGADVAVIDDLSTGFRNMVQPGVAFYRGSVTDGPLIDRIVAERGITAIIHLAGSVIIHQSVADPLEYYRNNTEASRGLIEHAVRNRIRHFIFSSTAAVYGVPAAVPVTEDMPRQPTNPYGASKWMTEVMLADAEAAHGLTYGILRYFNVAGADAAGRAGQSTRSATALIKVAAEAATDQRADVPIYGADYATPDGTAIRDYIHVSDLATAHVATLARLAARPQSLVMNCGYGHGSSVLEVLDAVEAVIGRPLTRRIAPRRPGDLDRLVASTDLIRSILDWRPRFDDLQSIVADALAWERRNLALQTS